MARRSVWRRREFGWIDPVAAAAGLAHEDWVLCLLSDGGGQGRWSYVAGRPATTRVIAAGDAAGFEALRPLLRADAAPPGSPPFAGGLVGLASYDMGARLAIGRGGEDWPDLAAADYAALLAFDHHERRVVALGRGADAGEAEARLAEACAWLDAAVTSPTPAPPAGSFPPEAAPEAYVAAVAEVVGRIAAGELFQANIARAWSGHLAPGADPFDVFVRLAAGSPAPFAAFWRLPGRALVSNSPELFLTLDPSDRRLEARPIKGTRPRGDDPRHDAELADELLLSAKDRAENLMIVDLMRNDLARVCEPGSVAVEALFAVETYATVHHLVSTVIGRLRPGLDAADVLQATFPPGSITGAPKHQAMKVIAGLEPPRGPWCGSLFLAGAGGGLQASVLIRTVSFTHDGQGWGWRTLAGAGIVADSEPAMELAETAAKIAAIRNALAG